MKFLRQRIKSLEDEMEGLNQKFRGEHQAKEDSQAVNQKLVDILQTMKQRFSQVKEKYRARVPKSCANCGQPIGNRRGKSNASDLNGGDGSEMDGFDYEDILKKAEGGAARKQPSFTEYSDHPHQMS